MRLKMLQTLQQVVKYVMQISPENLHTAVLVYTRRKEKKAPNR